jgi:hypothetical protein
MKHLRYNQHHGQDAERDVDDVRSPATLGHRVDITCHSASISGGKRSVNSRAPAALTKTHTKCTRKVHTEHIQMPPPPPEPPTRKCQQRAHAGLKCVHGIYHALSHANSTIPLIHTHSSTTALTVADG